MDSYPTKFTDIHGTEETMIANDGETLRIVLRGVEFVGTNFDSLEPTENATPELLSQFALHHNELCSCCIECTIRILITDGVNQSEGTLFVRLTLGNPAPNGWLDCEHLQIVLTCVHGEFAGSSKSGWFEDELLEIQSQLPEGVYMRACINCLYSDYSPYGSGAFGGMMCFRNLKLEYLKVKSKADFWAVHGNYDRMVQETFLCSEFERRVPRTGYRG